MERLIEKAARQIGMDVAEIRRRNLIPPDKLPYATPTLWTYDSGEFVRLMDKCLAISDWKGYAARKKASERKGMLRGRAVSTDIIEASALAFVQVINRTLLREQHRMNPQTEEVKPA